MARTSTTKELSTRLDLLIEEAKKNLGDIAEEIGIPRPTLWKYLNNKAEMPVTTLCAIARYFNVTTDYLLGMTDTRSNDPELRAAADYSGLSEDAIVAIKTKYSETLYKIESKNADLYFPSEKMRSSLSYLINFDEFINIIDGYDKMRISLLGTERRTDNLLKLIEKNGISFIFNDYSTNENIVSLRKEFLQYITNNEISKEFRARLMTDMQKSFFAIINDLESKYHDEHIIRQKICDIRGELGISGIPGFDDSSEAENRKTSLLDEQDDDIVSFECFREGLSLLALGVRDTPTPQTHEGEYIFEVSMDTEDK